MISREPPPIGRSFRGETASSFMSQFARADGKFESTSLQPPPPAPTVNPAPGSLSGSYGGVTASGTVGIGVGANVLVGGSGNSIALQPVSVEGTTGLDVAAGVAEMSVNFQPS